MENKRGKLVLVPTPIAEGGALHPSAWQLLHDQWQLPSVIIGVEELKVARRRWCHWGLPREALDRMLPFNEHNQNEQQEDLLSHLRGGGVLYLMSDGGLPAFCDPGQDLVSRCHDEGFMVTATPFDHSVALALALSGFPLKRYLFEGFPPRSPGPRQRFFKALARQKELTVLMDTPYRLGKVLKEVYDGMPERLLFLAYRLGEKEEFCLRRQAQELWPKLKGLKGEFILCLGPRP